MKIKLLIGLLICGVMNLQARYYHPKDHEQYMQVMNKYEYALVVFANQTGPKDKDAQKAWKKKIHLLEDTLKALSDTEPYKKSLRNDVAFVFVDSSRDSMISTIRQFDVQKVRPEYMIFKDGKAVTTLDGKFVKRFGFITKSDMLDILLDHFSNDFDTILAERADAQAEQRDMQIARYQAYTASRYPYGGYSPYNVWGSPSGSIYTGYAAFYPYGYSYNGYAYGFGGPIIP